MKDIFYRNRKKICTIVCLTILMFSLTSCRQGNWMNTVYTNWKDEFAFSNFWTAFWGWPIAVLSYPFAWLCSNIGKALGNSYAWGIFFTTLIVRTIAWPIYSKQNGMSMKMQLMQPDIDRIQKKYAGRTDPESKQRMTIETQQIYKKYKVNPLGCLFTTVLQFPIFMAMYETVKRINLTTNTLINGGAASVITRGKFALMDTKLFGIFELNTSFYEAVDTKDRIFSLVLAIAYGAISILSQKLAQKKPSYQKNIPNKNSNSEQQQKQMQMMTNIMTIMFIIFCLQSTSLALYWFIGGVYQIFQSYVGRKINEKNYYKMKEKI